MFLDSEKYYRSDDNFVYKKSGESPVTIFFDCLNEPKCIAGARLNKRTGLVETFGTHSDEKPDENEVMRIQLEAYLKKQARSAQHVGQSVLYLYKDALAKNFKGIWLPNDHKSNFLAKLRRIRKYEVEKKKQVNANVSQNRANAKKIDSANSPITPNTIAQATSQQIPMVSTKDAATSPFTPNTIAQGIGQNDNFDIDSSPSPSPRAPETPLASVLNTADHSVASTSHSSNVEKPTSYVKRPVNNQNASEASSKSSTPLQSASIDITQSPMDGMANVSLKYVYILVHFN